MRKFVLATSLLLAGCGIFSDSETTYQSDINPLGNVEYHTSELATELFSGLPVSRSTRIAVATFVPVTSLKPDTDQQHPLMLLGHQLEQGLMTEASRRGWVTQDFKVTNSILLQQEGDRVFSRDVAELVAQQGVDYFLSGTIVEQEAGAIVNARLIHVQSKDVVAAATKFFPEGLFWTAEAVTTRHGRLYRKEQ